MSFFTYESTSLDKVTDNFYGTYIISPGQYDILTDSIIEVTKTQFRIQVDTMSLNYTVAKSKLLYYENEPVNALELNLSSMSTINITPGFNELVNLVTNLLYLRPPSTIYLVYDKASNTFLLKNMNKATVARLEKIY